MAKDPHNKAKLEMTFADHVAIGSTPPQDLIDNPGKTFAETMDDDVLLSFLRKGVEGVAEALEMARHGGQREKNFLETIRDRFLTPDIAYLREIGRLPAEFADLDPATKFAL
jgi:hypothetical protein